MTNHFHLLLETPLGNLGEFMRRFNIRYTGYFNQRHKRSGHIYQGRYKSILVDKDDYLFHSVPVHSPQSHTGRSFCKVIPEGQDELPEAHRWSSLEG